MSVGVANVRRVIERWNRDRFLSPAPGQPSPQVCTPGRRRPRATLYDERPYDGTTCVDLASPALRYTPAVLGRSWSCQAQQSSPIGTKAVGRERFGDTGCGDRHSAALRRSGDRFAVPEESVVLGRPEWRGGALCD